MQDLLRVIGEAMGGEAGARLSQRLAMKCSRATILRLVCQSPLPSSAHVRVLGVDEWAWRKGQRYGTLLVDLEHHLPIDLLPDATAESFATWLQAHPSVELISRDRGTTFADGANRGAPQALQIADRWHLLHNLGESLEKVLTRHHADLKRVFTPPEEQDQLTAALDQQALTRLKALSQAEQLRQARREQREAVFMRVQELSAQGWSGASIARMLGIHKKTAVKYAAAEHFPERRDRGHKLALYLPFLQTQWAAGEHNTAAQDLAIHAQGYSGSETSVRQYITSLRKQVGPARRPRRYYPPISAERKRKPYRAVSSRQATWLVMRRPQDLSSEDQRALELVMQAHTQLEVACKLAQSFALIVREKKVSALELWLQEASRSEIAELRTFATGIKRDQAAVQAALT